LPSIGNSIVILIEEIMLKKIGWYSLLLVALAGLVVLFNQLETAFGAVTTPPDFTDALVASVESPTDITFAPDGRLLITTQLGQLYVYKNGALVGTPALTLSSNAICSNIERGLLGVVADPSFSSNRFIYVYYTFKKFGSCVQNVANSSPMNRVSRFTFNSGSDMIDPASELVIIDNIPSPNGNHNAGDLHFGPDGYLYISVGDGGCQLWDKSKCAGDNANARSLDILSGKILRVDKNGVPPNTNPFYNNSGARRCGNPAVAFSRGGTCQETYSWGLRNPFRFNFKPDSSTFYINDVGQNVWEEIDNGQAGADYGWNVREAKCNNGSTTICPPPPAGMTDPIYSYVHTGCNSITGGAFVPDNIGWPAPYSGNYLFSDYVCGKIFLLTQSGNNYSQTDFVTNMGASSAVALTFGPYQNTQALYYTTYASGGQIRRVSYSPNSNRPPNAVISANPLGGATPIQVNFDGSGSSDPDSGQTISQYIWDFGDGSQVVTTTVPTTNHNYTVVGAYTASLKVKDNFGATSDPATIKINAGKVPTILEVQPAENTLFRAGQSITLHARAVDGLGQAIPTNGYSWVVLKHHVDNMGPHTHPLFSAIGNGGDATTFNAPDPEDVNSTGAGNYLQIQLTVTDINAVGLFTVKNYNLNPKRVILSFATAPVGATITINSTDLSTFPTFPKLISWEGWVINVDLINIPGGLTFNNWSDGGTKAHQITTPPGATTYLATFQGGNCAATPTVVINDTDNDNCGSLRSAIAAAAAQGGGNTVGFISNVQGATIFLNRSLNIPTDVKIIGRCGGGSTGVTLQPAVSFTNAGYGVQLGGSNTFVGFKLLGFMAANIKPPLKLAGTGNQVACLKIAG